MLERERRCTVPYERFSREGYRGYDVHHQETGLSETVCVWWSRYHSERNVSSDQERLCGYSDMCESVAGSASNREE